MVWYANGVINDVFTAKIKAIANIFGSIPSFKDISTAIGVNKTAHALFEIKFVVIDTNIKNEEIIINFEEFSRILSNESDKNVAVPVTCITLPNAKDVTINNNKLLSTFLMVSLNDKTFKKSLTSHRIKPKQQAEKFLKPQIK